MRPAPARRLRRDDRAVLRRERHDARRRPPTGGADRSVANLADLLAGVSREGWPALVVGPAPVADEPHNDRISALTETFARICDARRTPYIDVFPALRADPRWRDQVRTGDGAHPSAAGYAAYAELVWPNWQTHLGNPKLADPQP